MLRSYNHYLLNRKSRSGQSLIETLFITLSLVGLICAIFDASIILAKWAILQNAVESASRKVSTGFIDEALRSGASETDRAETTAKLVREYYCKFGCDEQDEVQVLVEDSFGNQNNAGSSNGFFKITAQAPVKHHLGLILSRVFQIDSHNIFVSSNTWSRNENF